MNSDKYMQNQTVMSYDQNVKADSGKPKLSLVPMEILNCIARVREYGTAKYHDPGNWKKVEAERYVDAMLRHMVKYVRDKNSVDEESGLPHLWHLATNVAFLCELGTNEFFDSETQRNCAHNVIRSRETNETR